MLRNVIFLSALMAAPTLAMADGLADRATRSLSSCVAMYERACGATASAPQQCLMTGLQTCQLVHSGAVAELTDAMLQIRETARGGGYSYRTDLTTPGNRLTSGGGGAQGGGEPSRPDRTVEEINGLEGRERTGGGMSIDRDSYSTTVSGL